MTGQRSMSPVAPGTSGASRPSAVSGTVARTHLALPAIFLPSWHVHGLRSGLAACQLWLQHGPSTASGLLVGSMPCCTTSTHLPSPVLGPA